MFIDAYIRLKAAFLFLLITSQDFDEAARQDIAALLGQFNNVDDIEPKELKLDNVSSKFFS